MTSRLAQTALILLAACSAPSQPVAPDAGPCTSNALALHAVDYGGSLRYFVEITLDGRDVVLQLDTGSAQTFLYQEPSAPAYTPNLTTAQIGCETISVDGRNLGAPGDRVDGMPVVGLLGMNFLLDRPALLDLDERTLTRFDAFPNELVTPTTPTVHFDNVQGHALVPARLDDVAVRLMFDTGAGDTLWVGQQGQAGDRVEYVQDAQGTVFPVYLGAGVLALPGLAPRTVPIARAPAFPYFQQTVSALGGNLHGLLGPTACPGERLLFSKAESRFYLASRQVQPNARS